MLLTYGYRYQDGAIVVDEEQAKIVRRVFNLYNSRTPIKEISKQIGEPPTSQKFKHILLNEHYIGDEDYPPILNKEEFYEAQHIRRTRAAIVGHYGPRKKDPVPITKFRMREVTEEPSQDPKKNAEYIYSLIEEDK